MCLAGSSVGKPSDPGLPCGRVRFLFLLGGACNSASRYVHADLALAARAASSTLRPRCQRRRNTGTAIFTDSHSMKLMTLADGDMLLLIPAAFNTPRAIRKAPGTTTAGAIQRRHPRQDPEGQAYSMATHQPRRLAPPPPQTRHLAVLRSRKSCASARVRVLTGASSSRIVPSTRTNLFRAMRFLPRFQQSLGLYVCLRGERDSPCRGAFAMRYGRAVTQRQRDRSRRASPLGQPPVLPRSSSTTGAAASAARAASGTAATGRRANVLDAARHLVARRKAHHRLAQPALPRFGVAPQPAVGAGRTAQQRLAADLGARRAAPAQRTARHARADRQQPAQVTPRPASNG